MKLEKWWKWFVPLFLMRDADGVGGDFGGGVVGNYRSIESPFAPLFQL